MKLGDGIETLIVAGEIRHWNPATRLYESGEIRDERFAVSCYQGNWKEEQEQGNILTNYRD